MDSERFIKILRIELYIDRIKATTLIIASLSYTFKCLMTYAFSGNVIIYPPIIKFGQLVHAFIFGIIIALSTNKVSDFDKETNITYNGDITGNTKLWKTIVWALRIAIVILYVYSIFLTTSIYVMIINIAIIMLENMHYKLSLQKYQFYKDASKEIIMKSRR